LIDMELDMPWTALLSEQLEHLKTSLGVSNDELAQVLGTDRKTVYRWLADESFPQAHNRARLDALETLVDRLDESFKTPEGALAWLHAENGYFGGLKPIDALLRGRIDAVGAALEALDSGVYV
jgi:transcriptional regulator with XRE-family HTH domain